MSNENEVDVPPVSVTQVTPPIDHGECPHWDARTGLLHYVDMLNGRFMTYEPATKQIRFIQTEGNAAPVIPSTRNPHLLIVGLTRLVIALQWDGKSTDGGAKQKVLLELAEDTPTSLLNDGKADSKGRLWFGTKGEEQDDGTSTPNQGALYRITKDKDGILKVEPVIKRLNISNGIAFNKSNTKMYLIDTPSLQVTEYAFDEDTGTVSNPKVAFDLREYGIGGLPDGMTIDRDDNLWIALFGGGSIIKVDPVEGKLLQRIPLPAACVTSAAWGGPDLDVLYVTTSRYRLNHKEREEQPGAGSVYAITNTGTAGLPMFTADIL